MCIYGLAEGNLARQLYVTPTVILEMKSYMVNDGLSLFNTLYNSLLYFEMKFWSQFKI